jgi:hypothetical protein
LDPPGPAFHGDRGFHHGLVGRILTESAVGEGMSGTEEVIMVSGEDQGGRDSAIWPRLPLDEWRETHDTLHMWLQIVGKTRLALAPRQNHWWHVTLYVTSRGLTTMPMPYGPGTFEVEFDFVDHRLLLQTSAGAVREMRLRPQAVADFYREYLGILGDLGIAVKLWPVPVEVEHTVPFPEDRGHAAYDATYANRFWQALLRADTLLKRFQGRFVGKSSPVHFFWGAFDLAHTRFSGRPILERNETEWWVLREANSHEEISFGFWPGSGTVQQPAFYAYARPEPPGLATAPIRPQGAYYSRDLSDFILPYDDARSAPSPDQAVLDFLESVYDAAAELAHWDRAALDRPHADGEW